MEKKFIINGEEQTLTNLVQEQGRVSFSLGESEYTFDLMRSSSQKLNLHAGGANREIHLIPQGGGITSVVLDGRDIVVEELDGRRRSKSQGGAGEMRSPMPGWVLKVMVKAGDQVKKGDTLLVLEAMKMEHAIKATMDGVVDSIHAQAGDMVEGGVELISLKPNE